MSDRAKFKAACNKLAMEVSVAEVASRLMENARPVIDAGLQRLTTADERSPNRRNAKTNPPRAMGTRGLAIARHLAQGRSLSQIARILGVTRQSVWKWSHMPDVMKEVQRIHAEMIRTLA